MFYTQSTLQPMQTLIVESQIRVFHLYKIKNLYSVLKKWLLIKLEKSQHSKSNTHKRFDLHPKYMCSSVNSKNMNKLHPKYIKIVIEIVLLGMET